MGDPVNKMDPGGNLTEEDAAGLMAHHQGISESVPEGFESVTEESLAKQNVPKEKAKALIEQLKSNRHSAYRNTNTNEYTIVSTNTQTLKDWVQNLVQGAAASKDYSRAIAVARAWSNALTDIGADLSFAGHSKGGGMAKAMAMSVSNPMHMEADVVNPSTVSRATVAKFGFASNHLSLDISSNVVMGEAISLARTVANSNPTTAVTLHAVLGPPRGKTTSVTPANVADPVTLHNLEAYLEAKKY